MAGFGDSFVNGMRDLGLLDYAVSTGAGEIAGSDSAVNVAQHIAPNSFSRPAPIKRRVQVTAAQANGKDSIASKIGNGISDANLNQGVNIGDITNIGQTLDDARNGQLMYGIRSADQNPVNAGMVNNYPEPISMVAKPSINKPLPQVSASDIDYAGAMGINPYARTHAPVQTIPDTPVGVSDIDYTGSVGVPEYTPEYVSKVQADVDAGVYDPKRFGQDLLYTGMSIPMTAMRSGLEVGNLMTGGALDPLVNRFNEGEELIKNMIASDQYLNSEKEIQGAIEDGSGSFIDRLGRVSGAMANNPLYMASTAASAAGSMAIPYGMALGANKLMPLASKYPWLARILPSAEKASEIGNVLMNMGATYSNKSMQDLPWYKRYAGAGISGLGTYGIGRLTEGGAEGALARAIGNEAKAGEGNLAKASLKDFVQEYVEGGSDDVGQATAKGEKINWGNIAAKNLVDATAGAIMGGGSHISSRIANSANEGTRSESPENTVQQFVDAVKAARDIRNDVKQTSSEQTAEQREMNVPGRKGVTVDHINEKIKDNEALQATNVVQSVADLPANVQAEIDSELKSQGLEVRTDLVEGFRSKSTGEVYVIGDNLTPERVEEVARHETIGHYGLQGMMDQNEAGSYERLMKDISGAIESNKVLQQLRDEVMKSQPNITGFQLAEEIAAKMAERNMHNSFTQRIFGAIRRFLKKMRLIKGDVTDAQLSKYLRDSQKWLANNSAIKSGPIMGRQANMQKMRPAFSKSQRYNNFSLTADAKKEDTEQRNRIKEWLSPENLQHAKGKTRDQIFKAYDNTPMPIATLHPGYLDYFSGETKDNHLYSGEAYFVDHAINSHSNIGYYNYNDIQDILDDPTEVIRDTRNGRDNLIFTKLYDRTVLVAVSLEQDDDGRIVMHKSLSFNRSEKPYPSLNRVNVLPVDADPRYIHADTAYGGKRLSALDNSSNVNQESNEVNESKGENNGNFSIAENKKENEGRVLNREPGSFTAREQEVFDDFMSKRHDADRINENLKKYAGTGWAKQAVEAVFVRQAMNDLMNGIEPDYESSMDSPNVSGMRKHLLDGGLDALKNRAIKNGLIGNASKPINNVNSSFLNCNPSKACAQYCYATKGNYRYSNVIVKSEMITMLVEMDPVWTAEQVAHQYKGTREFHEEKALRLYDKGDGDAAWIPFIKELNKQDIRVQIFSKRAEFLRQVPDMNLRLLSIDESNMELADQNPDLPVAFVYAGEEQIDTLSKLADRDQIGVVLPVKVGRSVLHKEKVDALKKAVPAVKEFLCPIDAGYKSIGATGTKNKEGKSNWNCTMCDKAGGVGCYHGRVTKAVMDARAKVDASLMSADTPAELKAMQAKVLREALELKGMLDAYYSRINQQESGNSSEELGTDERARRDDGGLGARISDELGSKLQWLLQSIDNGTADTATGVAGRQTEAVRGVREGSVQGRVDNTTGRRVIPLKLVGDSDGSNKRTDKGRGNGRGNFSLAQNNGGFLVPDITVADNIIRSLQDQDIDIKRVQDAILRAGGAITDESDVYLNKTLYISKVADRIERMNKEFTDPILTLINESGVSFDEASEWLYARHVYLDDVNSQLAAINEGATNDDALSGKRDEDAERQYKALAGNKKLQEMADLVDKLMRKNVSVLVNSGLITPEEAHAWGQKYKHYVPLKRDNLGIRSETAMEKAKKWWKARGNAFKVEAEKNGPTSGAIKAGGVETRGKESKRRMGGKTSATNILGNVFASATAGIMRSEKQRVAHALLDMAKANPEGKFWTIDTPKTVKRINKQTGLVEVTYRDENLMPADNVFVVKVDGIEHWIVFNKDNARAMEMCKALKASDAPQLLWITQAIGELTRWTGGWLTTHNPVFALFNFMRDQQHMLFNLEDTPLRGKQLQVMKNLPGAMKGVWEVTRGERISSKWSQYFDEFKRNGAETGFINNFANINDRVTDLKKRQKELARSNANPMKWWSSFMDLVDDYNGITENGTRLAVYITARENGLSEMQAARIAKEITVDFNRKGQRSSMLNSFYMFTNANIQGHARMFRALKNSTRARWIAMAMVGLGAGLAYAARFIMGKDPETEEDKYDEISDFEKTTNWIFPIDAQGNYIKIPIAQGLHLLPSIGRIAVDTIIGLINDKTKDAKGKVMSVIDKLISMAYVTADAFNPLGSAGSPGQLITPSVFRPAFQVYENKSFTGSPLHREDAPYNGYNAPAYQKAFRKTPEHWTEASKMLNDLTGGDDVKPGKLNVAPETLRLLFTSMFMPGMSTNIDRALGSWEKSNKGREVRLDEMPVMNRVYGKAPNESMQESKYYERMGEMHQKAEQAKQYHKKYKDFMKKANAQAADYPETIPELKKELDTHKERYLESLKEMGDGNAKLGAARILMMDKLGKKVSELRRKSTIAEKDGRQDVANKLDEERMKVMRNFIKGGNDTEKLLSWYDKIMQR